MVDYVIEANYKFIMEILFVFVVLFVAKSYAGIASLESRIKFPSSSSPNNPYRSLDDLIDFSKYHHYNDLTDILKFTNKTYSNMVHLYSIGKSVQGRELWVMKLSTTPNELFTIGKPSVKLVANIHGNEPVGRELLLHLMKYILMNYESNGIIRNIIENTDVHLLFSMNPDGFENAEEGDCDSVKGRYNTNGYDLNRNFPDYFKPNRNIQTQPEAHAIMQWLQSIPFSLSASLHGGALVASYPYDNKAGPIMHWSHSEPSISPDDDTFRHLSLTYSKNNYEMKKGEACTIGDKTFANGITNGADWYLLTGGMQDYNYVYQGCMELTLELSCCKYPKVSELENHWNLNSDAFFDFIRQVHRGVYGTVTDIYGYPVLNATLYIRGRKIPFRTNSVGEFRRILLPGKYVLEVFSQNYKPTEIRFAVEDVYQPTMLQVVLEPGQNSFNYRPNSPSPQSNKKGDFFQTFTSGLSNIFSFF